MRVVFLGTPQFAVAILEKIIRHHEIIAVISQPDRAKDRKGKPVYTPVKEFALKRGIPVYQFDKIRENVDVLKSFNAEVMITAAYGQILSQEILDLPRYGVLNVHASLLPKYRGSSPIQTCVLNGDEITGVTIMQTALGMDTGDILAMRSTKVNGMNAGELGAKLAEIGGELLLEALYDLQCGKIKPIRQDDSKATKCRKFIKEDAEIIWGKKACEINNIVRAFNPNPIAYSFLKGQRIKIYSVEEIKQSGQPGEIICSDVNNGLVVACGDGAIRILSLQAPGKRVMTASEFLNGNKISIGEYFGN